MVARNENTVLVVEDDEEILSFVDILLSGEGYHIETARDGEEGLRQLHERRPSLILLDLTLAGMEGREFAERVRAEYGKEIPIIILSAGRNLDQVVAEVGADGYLSKPFELDDLLDVVHRWMG